MLVDRYKILKNRPYQIDIINKILSSLENKRYVLLDAPTGSGKTIISLVIADIYWKDYDDITHIAVRTSEQIKRFLEDSKKVNTIIKVLPNKRKTCPIFFYTNLSGEEIICKDCQLRNSIYEEEALFRKLEKYNYNFEELTIDENVKLREKGLDKFIGPKCIYQSFKKIDSNIIVTTYPYVFNEYLKEIAFKGLEPDLLILDESHNLLGSATNPFKTSFKSILERGFGKRKEYNELFKILKNEIEKLANIAKSEDKEYVIEAFSNIADNLLDLIENNIKKYYKTKNIEKILEESKEILIERDFIRNIFEPYDKEINLVLDWFNIIKEKVIKRELDPEILKKKWRIRTLIKMYFISEDEDIVFIQRGVKLEAMIINFKEIVRRYLDVYNRILLMSGTNFTREQFSKLFGVNKDLIEYIKLDIKIGKKEFKIIWNYTSKYEYRKLEENEKRLIDDIIFIINNCKKYQLYMFPSSGYMFYIYKKLPREIKEKILVDTGDTPLSSAIKKKKEIIFTYARSRFVEGIELTKNGRSLLKTIVIVGIPYPPPPNASQLTKKILEVNKINYMDYAEIMKDIQIKQVIGRAIRSFEDEVTVFFIDSRYRKAEIKKYF